MDIVFYNQGYVSSKDVSISIKNRSFNYGDGCFETIKVVNSKPFNFDAHFTRIKFSLTVLKLEHSYTKDFFLQKMDYLIKVNSVKNGSIKVHIGRSGTGRYLPKSNDVELLITTKNGPNYIKNSPISLCFYSDDYKNIGSLSNIKSSNSLIYILASIYACDNGFKNAILLNTLDYVVEVTNSNIFIVKDGVIITPKISDGCVIGTMRSWALNQLDIIEKSMSRSDILLADEVFISNSIHGFVPVKLIEEKSFNCFSASDSLQYKLINLTADL